MNSISQDKRAEIARLSERKLTGRELARYIWDRAHNRPQCFEQDIAQLIINERAAAAKRAATPPADMEGAVEAAANAVKLEWTVMCQEMGRDFPISSISPTNFRLLRAALTAALPALQRGVPDGWQLVPKEPTEIMLRAARDKAFWAPVNYAGHYRAMLAAAPVLAENGGQADV